MRETMNNNNKITALERTVAADTAGGVLYTLAISLPLFLQLLKDEWMLPNLFNVSSQRNNQTN